MREIGPGYGAVTERLCSRVGHLTCVEIDSALAEKLRLRPHLTVLCDSATDMSFPDSTFDGVVYFTMLHHVPSAAGPAISQVARTLRPVASLPAQIVVITFCLALCICSTRWLWLSRPASPIASERRVLKTFRWTSPPGMFRFRGRKQQNIVMGPDSRCISMTPKRRRGMLL